MPRPSPSARGGSGHSRRRPGGRRKRGGREAGGEATSHHDAPRPRARRTWLRGYSHVWGEPLDNAPVHALESARTLKVLLATARTRRWPPWRPRSSASEALDLMIIKPGIVNLTTKHKQRNSPRAGGATAEAIRSFISRFLHAEGQRPPWCNGSTGACGAPRPGSIGLWPENPGGGPIRISTQSSTAHWEESSQSEASTGLVRWRCALGGGR